MQGDFKLSTEYDGKPRRLWSKVCQTCQTLFWVPKNQLSKRNSCSTKCSNEHKRTSTAQACSFCGSVFSRAPSKLKKSKSQLNFCTRSCKDKAQRIGGLSAIQPKHYGDSPSSKTSIIRIRGHSCESCGLTRWQGQLIPLELDHVDGNAGDNSLTNLRLLCPNCHAQTPTYCGRNRGRGRKSRGLR